MGYGSDGEHSFDGIRVERSQTSTLKKQGLKQANTSMSVPPLASYKWAIQHKRNGKTTQKHNRDQIRFVPF